MKRRNILRNFSMCVLTGLISGGCAKVQQPRLESAEAYFEQGLAHYKKGQFEKGRSPKRISAWIRCEGMQRRANQEEWLLTTRVHRITAEFPV